MSSVEVFLGARDRLDVDFLALLAHRASAARVVGASSEGATVEPVLELLTVLGFPGLYGQAVLLVNLVPVPFGDHVERAEGDYPQVGGEIVDVAALEALLVLVILETGGRIALFTSPSSVCPPWPEVSWSTLWIGRP